MGKWRMGMLVLWRAPKLTEVVVGSVFLGFSFSFIHVKEMLVSFFSRYFTVSGNDIFWSASFPVFTVPIPYSFWWGLAFTGPSTWARRRIWASKSACYFHVCLWVRVWTPTNIQQGIQIHPTSSLPSLFLPNTLTTTNRGPQLIINSSWLPV